MIVYVESNFVLELALLQPEHAECTELLERGRTGATRLVIPAYALIEPYETVTRRHKARTQLHSQLKTELGQLLRT